MLGFDEYSCLLYPRIDEEVKDREVANLSLILNKEFTNNRIVIVRMELGEIIEDHPRLKV
jgi:hypothetical protein